MLFQKGWNPYSRFLDVDRVDLILRRNRGNLTEYREIQVKYRRLFEQNNPARWDAKLFSVVAWYVVEANEFIRYRPGFFVMFVFGYQDRRIESDVLIFPSHHLHNIIQDSPTEKEGGERKALYISKSRFNGHWDFWLSHNKFLKINPATCVDITKYCGNFGILD